METHHGTTETQNKVAQQMPKVVKRRRKAENGEAGETWEEYYDYIFPDDDSQQQNLKLLEMAHQWKVGRAAGMVEWRLRGIHACSRLFPAQHGVCSPGQSGQ